MRTVLIYTISLYQLFFSPDRGVFRSGRALTCPLYPTCSEYTKQAIQKHGIFTGAKMGIRRIYSCRPNTKPRIDVIR